MRKAVFMGKAGDFRLFLRAMRRWLTFGLDCTHHWVKENQSYGEVRVENQDFMKEAV